MRASVLSSCWGEEDSARARMYTDTRVCSREQIERGSRLHNGRGYRVTRWQGVNHRPDFVSRSNARRNDKSDITDVYATWQTDLAWVTDDASASTISKMMHWIRCVIWRKGLWFIVNVAWFVRRNTLKFRTEYFKILGLLEQMSCYRWELHRK